MKNLTLIRVSDHNGATSGVLLFDDVPRLVTLEDAWRDNETNISCIPEGVYKILRVKSQRFGDTYTVDAVEGRSLIRFHWGNTIEDTEGCILVGLKFGETEMPSIAQSQIGFKKFMGLMEDEKEARLVIVSTYGGGRAH